MTMEAAFSESEPRSGTTSLTASQMIEYLFCPRFTYFEYVLGIPQNEGKRFKVEKGREIHETRKITNTAYLRKKIGVIERKMDVYLSSSLGIRGIVDEILFLGDGSAAPLDYKYAEFNEIIYRTLQMQMTFYGRLIQDNFQKSVNRAFVVYTRSKNKIVEVEINTEDYTMLERTITEMLDIIQKGNYPITTHSIKRCIDCCYKNICEKSI